MKKCPATVEELSKELSLSSYTVSSVLNGKAEERRISQKTVKRVQDYVKEIGFHQDISALSMRGKYSREVLIAVPRWLFPHHQDAYFDVLFLVNKLRMKSISMVIEDDFGEFIQHVNFFKPRKVIMFASGIYFSRFKRNKLHSKQTNFFFYDYRSETLARPSECLGPNDVGTNVSRNKPRKQTIEMLIKQGFEKIIVDDHLKELMTGFCGNKGNSIIETLSCLPFPGDAGASKQKNIEHGIKMGQALLNFPFKKYKTAVFVGDDHICCGIEHCLLNNHVKIPDDISLVSWGGMIQSPYFEVPLTSWEFPHGEIQKLLSDWLTDKRKIAGIYDFEAKLRIEKTWRP